MENDDLTQQSPSIDQLIDQRPSENDSAQGTNNARKRSGKLSTEGERRKKARWRSKNRSRYNEKQREVMKNRRYIQSEYDGMP